MKQFLVLVGPSAAGKTELSRELFGHPELCGKFKTVMSTTTRSRRPSDYEYRHISGAEFQKYDQAELFAWTAHLGPVSHGTLYDDLIMAAEEDQIGVLILTPETAYKFKNGNITKRIGIQSQDIFVLYIWAPEKIRRERLSARNETEEFIEERLKEERINNVPWDDWCSNYARPFVDRFFANNGSLKRAKSEFRRIIKQYI